MQESHTSFNNLVYQYNKIRYLRDDSDAIMEVVERIVFPKEDMIANSFTDIIHLIM